MWFRKQCRIEKKSIGSLRKRIYLFLQTVFTSIGITFVLYYNRNSSIRLRRAGNREVVIAFIFILLYCLYIDMYYR